jgi:hypothetical protein
MFREEVYNALSSEFAVSIGVASSIKTVEVSKNPVVPRKPEEVKQLKREFNRYRNELQLHTIINRAIHTGRYRQLMRIVLGDKGRGTELSRYRRAWTELSNSAAGRVKASKEKKNEPKTVDLWEWE